MHTPRTTARASTAGMTQGLAAEGIHNNAAKLKALSPLATSSSTSMRTREYAIGQRPPQRHEQAG